MPTTRLADEKVAVVTSPVVVTPIEPSVVLVVVSIKVTVRVGVGRCSPGAVTVIVAERCRLPEDCGALRSEVCRRSGSLVDRLSTGTVTQTVNKAATTTTNLATQSPTVFGQTASFTATITVTAPGTGTPTGTVTFIDTTTGTTLGSIGVTTTGGVTTATFSSASLVVGTNAIEATYNGDGNFATSSGSANQTVNQAATTMALASSANPATAGATLMLTATVTPTSPGAGTPTGQVTFVDTTNGTTLGSMAVNSSGQAVLSISTLASGAHNITATYAGDTNFTTSNATIDQTIN